MTVERRGLHPSRLAGVRLVAAAAALGLASCGPNQAPPPVDRTASPSSYVGESPSRPPGVSVDPGLLEVLPSEVDGVDLQPDFDTAANDGSDLQLAKSAMSIMVAIAVAPGSSDGGDLAVASVIRLRPGVFDEGYYRVWRDDYDSAVCDVADGVQSKDEVEIDGRPVYVGTCVGGARTYHTYLADQGFIVSITATGERHFGELIMAGLNG